MKLYFKRKSEGAKGTYPKGVLMDDPNLSEGRQIVGEFDEQ